MTGRTQPAIECDVCVVGSGAGGAPVALELAKAGWHVVVVEKGGWFGEADFKKDERLTRRRVFRSKVAHEPHVLELPDGSGGWAAETTGRFWGGNLVGGATNFMSGYFHRLKPEDFRLLSEFGPIEGANVVDWPITYDDLEPYYTKVEHLVGMSGRIVEHPHLEPRSTPDYPYPPTAEHPVAARFDRAARSMGLHPLPLARAVLTQPVDGRQPCEYSGYCGGYGCRTGAKGSARAALIDRAVTTGHCELITGAKAHRIDTDERGNAVGVDYFDAVGRERCIRAGIVVIACYPIESIRLLLTSTGRRHPNGVGNRHGQVGRNLHCCAGGTGHGIFDLTQLDRPSAAALKERGPFFNRALQDWYFIDHGPALGGRIKGGTIDFVFDSPTPTADANRLKWDDQRNLIWGSAFKRRLKTHFTEQCDFKFEVFCDWLPNDDCHITLDHSRTDRWGTPVARIRTGHHPHDERVAQYLVDRGTEVMKAMGAHRTYGSVITTPTSNLVAGGLRFGTDPRSSVLDQECRVHGTDNVFVTDGSFMPTGGSVTPTWTIYANAFRVADGIAAQLGRRADSGRATGAPSS